MLYLDASAVCSAYLCTCILQAWCKGVLTATTVLHSSLVLVSTVLFHWGVIFKWEITSIASKMREIWETSRTIRNTDASRGIGERYWQPLPNLGWEVSLHYYMGRSIPFISLKPLWMFCFQFTRNRLVKTVCKTIYSAMERCLNLETGKNSISFCFTCINCRKMWWNVSRSLILEGKKKKRKRNMDFTLPDTGHQLACLQYFGKYPQDFQIVWFSLKDIELGISEELCHCGCFFLLYTHTHTPTLLSDVPSKRNTI